MPPRKYFETTTLVAIWVQLAGMMAVWPSSTALIAGAASGSILTNHWVEIIGSTMFDYLEFSEVTDLVGSGLGPAGDGVIDFVLQVGVESLESLQSVTA